MNTILWFQSETVNGKDNLYVDGKLCVESNRHNVMSFLLNNRNSSFSYLKRIESKHQWFPLISNLKDIVDKCLSDGVPVSPNLMCYIDNDNGLMFRAHFNETDETGRKTVYTYYTNEPNIENALQNLKEFAISIGKTCKPEDLEIIKRVYQIADKEKKNGKVILIFILIIIILLICAIIILN